MNAQLLPTPEVGPDSSHDLLPRPAEPASLVGSWIQQIWQCIAVGSLAVASYFFISHYVLQSVEVVGASMAPTLHNSERLFVNHWIYMLRAPERGDIIILKDPTDGVFCVKRIIALPGESIHFKHGEVWVNGTKLKEPYLVQGTRTFMDGKTQEQLITLGKDRYYVLGDNRNNSMDSRVYGAVPRQNILGSVFY